MRIEILIGNDDPIIYPLNKPKITLGSSDQCDIILPASGLSRKHISIVTEGDSYFVIDQGSTNGSFMNEERLVPGKRVEFTSFFPVRLGDQVLVSLLSDDEGETGIEIPATYKDRTSSSINIDVNSEKTSVISLADLNQVKTEKLVLQRNQKRTEFKKRGKKAPPPPKKTNSNYLAYLILITLIGIGYYNYKNAKDSEITTEVAEVGKIIPLESNETEVKETPYLISEADVPSTETVSKYLNSLKCTTDIENKLCDYFPHAREGGFGVVQSGLTFYVLVNAGWFFEEAKKFTRPPIDNSPASLELHQKLLKDVAVYIYLMRLSPDLDLSDMEDVNIIIGLFRQDGGEKVLVRSAALKAEALSKLKDYVFPDNLRFTKSDGVSALNVTKDYYRTF